MLDNFDIHAWQRQMLNEGLNENEQNPKDVIKTDVPLFIRLLEYAREDAKDDMDLHNITENIIKLSENGKVLGMDSYDKIVNSLDENKDKEDPYKTALSNLHKKASEDLPKNDKKNKFKIPIKK